MTQLSLSTSAGEKTRTDALVVGVTSGPDGPALAAGAAGVDAALGGRLLAILRTVGAAGKPDELTKIADAGSTRASVLVAVGLGPTPADGAPFPPERLRAAAGAATRSLAGTESVSLTLPGESAAETVAVIEGALLGAYAFNRYRTREGAAKQPVQQVTVHSPRARDKDVRASVDRAQALAEAVLLARDMINTPAADMHPADFADLTLAKLKGVSGVTVEVLDEKALRRGGYGGIIGVGQGSTHPPRLVRVAYSPGPHAAADRTSLWSVRASRSTPAGCLSSRPRAWSR